MDEPCLSSSEKTQYNTNIISPNTEEVENSKIPAGELMNKRELSSDSSVEDVTRFSNRKNFVPPADQINN